MRAKLLKVNKEIIDKLTDYANYLNCLIDNDISYYISSPYVYVNYALNNNMSLVDQRKNLEWFLKDYEYEFEH